MSVVEASDATESTDDSVQYVGSTNPMVEGEVKSGSTASEEEPSSAVGTKRKSPESKEEPEDPPIRKLHIAEARLAKKQALLKEVGKEAREAKSEALKLSKEKNQLLEKEIAKLRACSGATPERPVGTPKPALQVTSADSPTSEQPSPLAEPSVAVPTEEGYAYAKKPRNPRKAKAMRG